MPRSGPPSVPGPIADLPIHELVAAIRARRELTQEGLARELGVAFSTVNAWEAGRSEPQVRHRHRLRELARAIDGAGVAPEVSMPPRPVLLVVDDDPMDLELLLANLGDALGVLGVDAQVHGETDPVRALLLLGQRQPAVAFVDVYMPGLDGFELADRIDELPELQVGSLVLVTAGRSPQVERRAADRGLTVLDKPVELATLGAVLRGSEQVMAAVAR